MVKIQKIFFCDNVELSQFNKRNFIGAILSKEIEISSLPYSFFSNLVILGETEKECKLNLQLSSDGTILYEVEVNIELGKKGIVNGIEKTIPIVFNLNKTGQITIKIFERGDILYSDDYEFIIGDSPYLNQVRHLPNSGLLVNSDNIKLVDEIICLAKTSLIIIDNHIRSQFDLAKLLKSIQYNEMEILVFTKSQYKKQIEITTKLFIEYPNLKIYYITPSQEFEFHDRFLIADRTEYYIFGASFNDISNKKISGFKKITSAIDIDAITMNITRLIY